MTENIEFRLLRPPRVVHWLAVLFTLFGLAVLIKVTVLDGNTESVWQGVESMSILGLAPYCAYAMLWMFFLVYAIAYMLIDLLSILTRAKSHAEVKETLTKGLSLMTAKIKSLI